MDETNFAAQALQRKLKLETNMRNEHKDVEFFAKGEKGFVCAECGDQCRIIYKCEHGQFCKSCLIDTYDVGIGGKACKVICRDKFGNRCECVYKKIELL